MTKVNTNIPARERLIFALDVPDIDEAQALITKLGDVNECSYTVGHNTSIKR